MSDPGASALVTSPSYAFRFVAASAAIGIVLVGGIPMAVAAASPNADPILATAVDGTPDLVNFRAPTVLARRPARSAGLAGRAFVGRPSRSRFSTRSAPRTVRSSPRSFARPIRCSVPCPRRSCSSPSTPIPCTPRRDYLLAFDKQENLSQISNWTYLTGPLSQLEAHLEQLRHPDRVLAWAEP